MTRYALVGPHGQVDRIAPEGAVDPNVQTKQGWRWLAVDDVTAPDITNEQTRAVEYVAERDKVMSRWTVEEKPPERIAAEERERREASISKADLEDRIAALEKALAPSEPDSPEATVRA